MMPIGEVLSGIRAAFDSIISPEISLIIRLDSPSFAASREQTELSQTQDDSILPITSTSSRQDYSSYDITPYDRQPQENSPEAGPGFMARLKLTGSVFGESVASLFRHRLPRVEVYPEEAYLYDPPLEPFNSPSRLFNRPSESINEPTTSYPARSESFDTLSEHRLVPPGEGSGSYSLICKPDVSHFTEKAGGPSKNPRDKFPLTGIQDHDGAFLPKYPLDNAGQINSGPTDTTGAQHDPTVGSNGGHIEWGRIGSYRQPNNSYNHERSPETATDSLRTKWRYALRWERVVLCFAIFFMISTFISVVCAFKLYGQGRKIFVRKVFVWGILIMDFNVGVVMVAVRRNLGEVLFSITLVLVFGIFLNSYLDVLGYGPT
jgi:hypothetical protein